MAARAPAFNELTTVFDRYLLSHVITDAAERARVVAHLQRDWFDETSSDEFFPGVPVASIYAQGVLRALDLALAGRRVVPLNAWRLLNYPEVTLLSMADVDQAGVTDRWPRDAADPDAEAARRRQADPADLGETARGWVTEFRDNSVRTIDAPRVKRHRRPGLHCRCAPVRVRPEIRDWLMSGRPGRRPLSQCGLDARRAGHDESRTVVTSLIQLLQPSTPSREDRFRTLPASCPGRRSAWGRFQRFPTPRLNGRCWIRKQPVAADD